MALIDGKMAEEKNLGNSGWKEKLKFSKKSKVQFSCKVRVFANCSIKYCSASSNPVGCSASPNTGDFKIGEVQQL